MIFLKILLMSVKAGYGHHSTAKAIIEKFSDCGHECEMLDIFEYINPHLSNTVQDGYLLSTKYLPEIYGKVYDTMAEKDTPYKKYSPATLVSKLVSHKLRSYVELFSPDLVIGTHSYAGMVMTNLAESGTISCPTMGVVTDFTVHPFWESTKLDYYVIADKRLTYEMIKKGIPEEKVLPIGIPIRKQFESKLPQSEARQKLGLADKKTILIMMGSMGYGNIKKPLIEIDESDEDFQVVCICGSNERMRKAISKYPWRKDIRAYGFMDNIDIMMDSADIIVSKPGGLTTSETLAKGLPMITMNPIPGQEDKNLMFLLNNGAVATVNETYTIGDVIHQLFGFPERLDELTVCAKRLGKPSSTQDLYDFCEANFFAKETDMENSLVAR